MKPVVFALLSILSLVPLPGATYPREVDFSGETWQVKSSESKVSPGPNHWSDSPDSVWVDEDGMHLTVRRVHGRWECTEVNTKRPTGYGTYTFVVDGPFASFEPQVVAGFFTWDTDEAEANRELDIEFAAWGQDSGTKGQYVVQPYADDERIHIFEPRLQGTYTTHRIVWTPWSVVFSSYHGNVDPDLQTSALNLMQQWRFSGLPPSGGNAAFRINLWLFEGKEPKRPVSMTIKSFSFEPLH
jgi:hypothetical protein